MTALLAEAREMELRRDEAGNRDQRGGHYLSSETAERRSRFAELQRMMRASPGSEAGELIDSLEISAEIYSYYHRAAELDDAGAPLGLLNNWVREDWMKRRFMQEYRMAEAADRSLPRVVVKAGYFHAVRGRGPGNVFTLGNFLHEFAIANGMQALSVQVLPLREWWTTHEAVDPEYKVLLPADAMERATLVDLRPIRAHVHSGNAFGLEGAALRTFRDLVFGVDFALFVPSRPGSYSLTAAPPRH